jgi:cell division septal protein FtsQ
MTNILPPDDDSEVVVVRKVVKSPVVPQDAATGDVLATTTEPPAQVPVVVSGPESKLVKVVSIVSDEDLGGPLPVMISDDDQPGNDGTPSGHVTVDQRLSDRRREVDRLITRRRIFVGLGILAILLLVLGTLAVFASTLFDVRTVTIYGNVYTTDEQLQPILAELKGKPILTVDINKARAQLEALPFVRQADIATKFPHTVHIEIEERHPALGYPGSDGQWRVIDETGRILTLLPGQPSDFKPINDIGPNADAGQYAPNGYGAAATISRSLPAELQPYMASFNVSPAGDVALVLTTGTVINFGQPTDMTAKLAAVLTQFRKTPPSRVASIDASNPAVIGVIQK